MALHRNFVCSAVALKKDLVRTAFYLVAILEAKIHRMAGFDRLTEYTAAVAGLTPQQTKDLLCLGRRLRTRPELTSALRAGDLTWAQARRIVRSGASEWLEPVRAFSRQLLPGPLSAGERGQEGPAGQAKTVGAPEALGSPEPLAAPASAPSPPAPASPVRPPRVSPPAPTPPLLAGRPGAGGAPQAPSTCHLQLRFTPEQLARWEGLTRHIRNETPYGRLSREELILEGMASLGAAAGERAGRASRDAPYLIVLLASPGTGEAALVTSRGEAAAPSALLSVARCDAVLELPDGRRRRTIPPRLRRLALQRARYRCEAEGCLHTLFLEVHHKEPHACGGAGDLSNLVVLCSNCHRKLHEAEQMLENELTVAEIAARGVDELF